MNSYEREDAKRKRLAHFNSFRYVLKDYYW